MVKMKERAKETTELVRNIFLKTLETESKAIVTFTNCYILTVINL
jgi:hypothetical protein